MLVRIGGWLFERRTLLPLPLALALLALRTGEAPRSSLLAGAGFGLVAAGEGLRLWAVRHIGAVSRTRSDRLGPLVTTGPFGLVRNPLYLGNILLWTGFAVTARLLWMAPVVIVWLGLEYHAIVRWEEQLLEARRGAEYTAYAAHVPRWVPSRRPRATRTRAAVPFSWRQTVFSERGTLIAIAVGLALLWIKARF